MQARYSISVDEFSFGPRANQLGLSASIKPTGKGGMVLTVTGPKLLVEKLTEEIGRDHLMAEQ